MTSKLEEHAAWLTQDPDDVDGVIFTAKVRMKKVQVEAGLIELAALGAGWKPESGEAAGDACNAAVVRFSNSAVISGRTKQIEAEKQAEIAAFRAMLGGE